MIYDYEDLYPLCQPYLPGIETPLLLQTLREAGRALCQDTEAWEEWLTAINLVASTADYTLTVNWEADIQRLLHVRIGTTACPPTEESSDIDPNLYDLRVGSTGIRNVFHFLPSAVPATAATAGLLIKVALVPRIFCTELPGHFMEEWGETLVAYALWQHKATPNRTWTDFPGSQAAQLKWNQGKGRAKREREHGRKVGILKLRGEEFF